MRLAPKLCLFSATALTALSMSASASANTPVEIHDEKGNHCDPCVVHLTGESVIIIGHMTILSRCEDELVVEIWEDGSGHIPVLTNQNHGGGSCTVQKCNGTGEASSEVEWEFDIEETGPETEELDMTLCFDTKSQPNGTGLHCPAHLPIDGDELVDHIYTVHIDQPCPSGPTIVGRWTVEGSPIEIEHP